MRRSAGRFDGQRETVDRGDTDGLSRRNATRALRAPDFAMDVDVAGLIRSHHVARTTAHPNHPVHAGDRTSQLRGQGEPAQEQRDGRKRERRGDDEPEADLFGLPNRSCVCLWVSNSSSGCRRELDQPPTVRDPTHTVEFGTGDGVSSGDA